MDDQLINGQHNPNLPSIEIKFSVEKEITAEDLAAIKDEIGVIADWLPSLLDLPSLLEWRLLKKTNCNVLDSIGISINSIES